MAAKTDICLFVEKTLSPLEFYALFIHDHAFCKWITDHTYQNKDFLQSESCPHCKKLLNERHLVVYKEEFWENTDALLAAAREKFSEFQCARVA